jgi:hypothetical protein
VLTFPIFRRPTDNGDCHSPPRLYVEVIISSQGIQIRRLTILICRIVIPIRKFILSEEQYTRPIPTLSDRQFVVQKSKLSESETRTQRVLFWYRERLFETIRGHWREVIIPRHNTAHLLTV